MVYFDYSGHLNDETIAMYAKSIVSKEEPTGLSPSVIKHFEECESCKTEILDFAEVITGNYDYLERLSKGIHNPENDKVEEKQSDKIRHMFHSGSFRFFLVAALLVVFVAVSWFVFRPVTAERLFNKYYSPYNNILTMKSSGINKLNQGLLFYDLKMYDSAAIYFQWLLNDDPVNQDAGFYLANALLASGKAKESIPLFLNLQNISDGKYLHPSRWLLGLAYLRVNDTANAKKVFQQIVDAQGFYSANAGKILSKIK